ncbi:MAG TPA: DNA-processing protein DprA [Candidatus Omnitrophota bacterium]|nr:DNA-processing protein DprA [Candidatus Omnitrophota bacterium]HPT38695.1 DNA-processing protein DprA [Candidatus Omnitrophota bacterium]
MDNFEALVSLNLIPQIGSQRLSRLLEHFGQPREIFKAGFEPLAAILGPSLSRDIRGFDIRSLKNDLALASQAKLAIITIQDEDYPQSLRQIPAPPIVLYCLGRIIAQDSLAVGIVGSRKASFYGLSQAENFSARLSAQGVTIVSGMARGVDTYAHRGALKAKGRTIAVMGSGFSHIYPQENADLAQEISKSGAVISEFSMETKPLPVNFPRRNRLISGLSQGVLITEAARNSGALITANFALEQGREVFALPGRIDATGSMGTNLLLKEGAKLVTCCEDICEELNFPDQNTKVTEPVAQKAAIPCAKEENLVYACMRQEPLSVDDLVAKTSLSSSQVLDLVLKLQFKKLIKALPGKQFIRLGCGKISYQSEDQCS